MDFKRKVNGYAVSCPENSSLEIQTEEKCEQHSSTIKKLRSKKFSSLTLKNRNVIHISPVEVKVEKQRSHEETNKRSLELSSLTSSINKKIKKLGTSERNVTYNVELKEMKDNNLLFEDTLCCIESTQDLIKQSNKVDAAGHVIHDEKTNTSSCTDILKCDTEFDAFKVYFGKEPSCSTGPSLSDEEEIEEEVQNDSTQFFINTQILNQLDSAVLDSSKRQKLEHEQNTAVKIQCDDIFKIPDPLKESHPSNKLLIETNEKSRATEDLFNKELLTTQCRKEVDTIFERLETSIFLMGTGKENDSRMLPDEVFDIIFSSDNNTEGLLSDDNILQEKTNHEQAINSIDWSNETLLNATGIDSSFGTVFKHALEVNASKSACVEKHVNKSLVENNSVFLSMGPFYGLSLKVKELIKHYKGIEELYRWQDECLKLPAIEMRKNLIYALPTSGGKTLVAEILILREILCYKRNALFILPYVAIVQEKVWALSPFAVALDFLVEEYASSKGVYPPRKRRRKNSVYIATIEKASGLVNSLIETERLNELGLIVVDELHLIGEQSRGVTLEAMLTKLMHLKANIQIVGMSATIGNLEDIQKFLNADTYTQNFRPVELTEYVKCGSQIAKINWNVQSEDDLLTDARKVNFSYSNAVSSIDPDNLGGLVMEVIPKGSCLIFCSSKKNCENVAYLLCRVVFPNLKEHKKDQKEQLIRALKDEGGALCNILRVSIQYGIAYHHSGLTSEERRLIEDSFKNSVISVICCTSTLAAGVNLPAQRVILRQPYIGREFINLSRYKQMVGRAGRAGLGHAGDSIVICAPQDLHKLRQLLMSPMDQALSSMHMFDGKGLNHLLLSCISLGISKNKVDLIAVASNTLMAVQAETLDVNIEKLTEKVIVRLFKSGALQISYIKQIDGENGLPSADISVKLDNTSSSLDSSLSDDSQNKIKKKKRFVVTNTTELIISKLGSAAIKGGLEIDKAHVLYEDLVQTQRSLVLLDVLHLLFLVTPYDIAEQIKPNLTIYYTLFSEMTSKQMQTAKILGLNESVAVKMLANQPIKNVSERVLNRFYLTLMLNDLWNEKPVFEVSEKYQINRGVVQNLMTAAASFSSNVVNFCDELEEFWAFAHLLRGMSLRLSHCCMKELLPLMELPSVKQSRAKQLYNAGYKTLQSIAKANANDLVENIEYMPKKVANQLIAASKMLLLEKIENLREEAEDVLDGVETNRPFNHSIM